MSHLINVGLCILIAALVLLALHWLGLLRPLARLVSQIWDEG